MSNLTDVFDEKMAEADKQRDQKQYEEYVSTITPTHNIWLQMLKAFLVGGVICTIGELLMKLYSNRFMMEQTEAAKYCTLTLIFLGVILTGFNIYQIIARFGGAGALVPITGFANSVAAPAIEYKTEGHVFGIGAKIFSIAGPVILFGILLSWGLGIFYWLFG